MDHAVAGSVKKKLSLDFRYLPSFAAHILHNDLDDFVTALKHLYQETDIPVMRFFKSMPEDQRVALVTASSREMLTMIACNNASQYIEQSIDQWLNNQLPLINREQVDSQDITLVNYVRAKALRQFIPRYSQDFNSCCNLVEEVDRFTVVLNSELFTSYMELQEREINSINKALKKREQQLLEAQDIGHVGSFEWDIEANKSSLTPQVLKIFDMEGSRGLEAFLEDVHPDDREKLKKALDKAFVNGDYECEYRYMKNGKEKVILSRAKVQFTDGKPSKMIGTVVDVTERHRIIQKLQESELLHKQAQALTHIGNWSWFVIEKRIVWSDEMYRIHGLEPQSEEISYERFLSFVHPSDRDTLVRELKKSRETLYVPESHFRIVSMGGVVKVLRAKAEWTVDFRNEPLVLRGTCQDVTHEFMLTKKLQERERYLEELNRSLEEANQELSRKNEELESFNFIASHDLQEPLRKIQIYSNRILESGINELRAPLRDYFEKITNASGRMQRLIEDFLSFSQTFNNPQSAEEVDLNVIVREILAELGTRIEEKQAQIEISTLPKLFGVPFQVKQLMTNLMTNALKYTRPGVAPRITITGEILPGWEIPHEVIDREKAYAKVSVADNGIGFDIKYTSKIFELFQRLHSKDVYSGTGIGLALCKKIVQNMNGFITADSQPEKGSVFSFYVPVKENSKAVN